MMNNRMTRSRQHSADGGEKGWGMNGKGMRLAIVIFLMLVLTSGAGAQDPGVYVTVQDNTALRAGPGVRWDRLAVLPYGTTYRATGRTVDGDWIQIAYEGELEAGARTEFTRDGVTYGWTAYWLLVWTGDILTLPIDGVGSVPTARAAGPTMVLNPGEYMYKEYVDPSTRVENPLTEPVTVEVTGRIGNSSSGGFWIQFKFRNEYYWTGSWAVGTPGGYLTVPDRSYLYSYGRLLDQTRRDYNQARSVYSDISSRWNALNTGQPTTCNRIPDDIATRGEGFRTNDLTQQALFQPIVEALDNAQTRLNAALAQFRAICGELETRQPVTPEIVAAALVDVAEAQRNLNTVRLLLVPFERRDPLLGRG